MQKNKYSLLTCIAMIIGVVIGSGIFFKSDNILIATDGNILAGVIAFFIAAISIIFGSLTIAELAARTHKPGGIITYAEEAYNGGIACSFGWFQTFLYYPTLIAVVSYVIGIYTCMLFGINEAITVSIFNHTFLLNLLEIQILIGFITILFFFIINMISKNLAGYFQTSTTIIKLIPLILLGICGLILGTPTSIAKDSYPVVSSSSSWLTALVPIVFAFDGWIVATSIAHEVKNAKRNVPLALIVAPLLILTIYLVYFVGISLYLRPETIIANGDHHVSLAAMQLLGPWASKALLVFIIISVAGTANGLIMALIQCPYSLALRNMFPHAEKVSQINPKWEMPICSAIISLLITLLWLVIHYIAQKFNILPNSDISEISITLQYVAFILLYIEVFRLGFKGEIKGFFKSKFNPIMAILGSLIILYVGMQNPLFVLYLSICSVLLMTAYCFWLRSNKNVLK